ncbi:SWIM zinc finger family protein [Streptomyces cellostaticus]|uniref:SWIM zinc finger family protein n=1 Tax=Streptomyces cellostaticus TaxID=67285 RepID=UPI0020273A99|nr:SWIM zinc finger family protein [Streptomyces cellostaticus]
MTSGDRRPGDAAREALRTARGRTGAAQRETDPEPEGAPAGTDSGADRAAPADPRPGDIARAALRAVTADPDHAGAQRSGPPAEAAASSEAGRAGGAAPSSGTAPSPDAAPPGGDAPASGAASAGERPGDVAREALRAARREASRARAAEGGAGRGGRASARRASGPSRTPAASGPPGEEPRAARARAVQDMRQFLNTAFRMPSSTDGPEITDAPGAPESPEGGDEPGDTGTPVRPDRGAAAPPPVPGTMATPHRDSELRRTFPAFPPRTAREESSAFAGTWWGNAWVDALERGALDARRLARGRGYADGGNVDAITVTPGLVLAYVRGSRPRPYRVQVRLRTLEDDGWERFLDAAADRPGHIAALLDRELPESLADCGVPLLPGPRDLAPRCSCPDSAHPCKHAAALCYQTARLLDADPFVLLLLRGRGERELLDALSRRSAARSARAAREGAPSSLPGIRAADALAPRRLPPLPQPLPVPPHPEQPPVYPAAPGGPDPLALDQLATDAAARAHALLTTGADPVGELTLWQDAVRLAAARPGSGLTAATRALYATLAAAVGRTPAELARAVAAWRQGGPEGLAVLEDPWDPPAGRFDRARPLLLAADLPAFRPWRNHLTHPRGHVQLRLGRDGLWYAYESEPGRDDWWPRGTADPDPVGALTGLGAPDES